MKSTTEDLCVSYIKHFSCLQQGPAPLFSILYPHWGLLQRYQWVFHVPFCDEQGAWAGRHDPDRAPQEAASVPSLVSGMNSIFCHHSTFSTTTTSRYHHVLTLNYAVCSYSQDIAYNSWITWMNFTVHSIMYGWVAELRRPSEFPWGMFILHFSYYMLRSCGVRVPAWVARNITTMQIMQFIITHFILFHVGYLVSQGVKVDSTPKVFWLVATLIDLQQLLKRNLT